MILSSIVLLKFLQDAEKFPVETPALPEFFRAPSRKPVLTEVTMGVHVAAKHGGVVTLPVPGDYSGQCLVAFRVSCQPASAMKSWAWRTRPDGQNSILEAVIEPSREPLELSYVARVMLPGSGVTRTMRKDFESWQAPSASVQSSDPAIVALSKKLVTGSTDRGDIVARIVAFVAKNKVREDLKPNQSDAKSALTNGGDSLGRANLCAALFRAAGIPARTVATLPTWGEVLNRELWLTEYENDDHEWEMTDPFVGLQHAMRDTEVVLSISNLKDEDRTESKEIAFRPDAPYLSTPTLSPGLTWARSVTDPPRAQIRLMNEFPMMSGSRLMPGAKRRSFKVLEAAKQGQASWFDEKTFADAIRGGPINLALFFDGLPTLPHH